MADNLVERQGEGVEVVDDEFPSVGRLRVVAVADVEDVLRHVFLHHKPRAAAEAQTLALPDGVEPQAAVLANAATGLQLYHVAGLFAQVAADIVVVVNLAEEADALRVLAVGADKVFALSYLAHLVLHVMADGEEGLL